MFVEQKWYFQAEEYQWIRSFLFSTFCQIADQRPRCRRCCEKRSYQSSAEIRTTKCSKNKKGLLLKRTISKLNSMFSDWTSFGLQNTDLECTVIRRNEIDKDKIFLHIVLFCKHLIQYELAHKIDRSISHSNAYISDTGSLLTVTRLERSCWATDTLWSVS